MPRDLAKGLPGVVPVTEAEYNAADAVRNSELGYLLRSPAHYRAYKTNPPRGTDAQEFGTAAHYGILEPQKFYARYAPLPEGCDLRTTAGKAAKAGVIAGGLVPLKADDFQAIERMIEAVYSHPTASKYLTGGVVEHAYYWTDPETGIRCKAKPDYLRADGIYIDLKTTSDFATAEEFSRTVAKWGYHRQSAFYTDGLMQATGIRSAGTVFIVVETDAPHGVGVFLLDEAATDFGRIKYKQALSILAECRSKNSWPGYPVETQTVSLPRWMQ